MKDILNDKAECNASNSAHGILQGLDSIYETIMPISNEVESVANFAVDVSESISGAIATGEAVISTVETVATVGGLVGSAIIS